MRILVTDGLSPRGVEVLRQTEKFEVDVRERLGTDDLLACIDNYDGLIVRSATKVTAPVLQATRRLKVVGRAGVGVDNVDVEAATARGVLVMNAPSGNTLTTAEHTFSLLLALTKNVPQATASMKGGRWEKKAFVSVEVAGKTLGVIGLGRIGGEVARRGKGFAMRVIAYDPFISEEAAAALGVELVELPDLFRRADFITIHTPLTPETHHLIDGKAIAQMRTGVRIVNCARGGIVDEAALYEALKSRKVAGAALDVFEQEPITNSPLFELPNFICTPHLGASSEEAQENVAVEIAQQIVDYLQKGIIRNAVNAPSMDPELYKVLQPYLTLSEKLGRLASQLAEGRMHEVRIDYRGEIAGYDPAPLTAAVVKGALDPFMEDAVNYVNALALAKGRSIRVIESKVLEEADYTSLITVAVRSDRGTSEVAGTLFSRREPRVIRIDEFRLEAIPEGYLLIFSNLDVPGVIGTIGTLLGKHQVNIAGMSLGRERPGGRAVSVVNVDTPIPAHVLEEIRRLPNIVFVKLVKA
ncbi:MAG: phosphoglycerate dehydrogenase [candidate division NC10 bacterium]|nr:phosphoglycerate dehydrogenase [candidate division NC10 bacterium]